MNRFQKIFSVLIPASLVILFFYGCTQTSEIRDKGQNQQPKQVQTEKYEQEGFITKDLYRVIIVKPAGSQTSSDELEKQLRIKVISSIKKYITSKGKSLTANANAEILNLVNTSGTIREFRDSTRDLFILDVAKQGCRPFVDSLGQ